MKLLEPIRAWLFGTVPPHGGRARSVGAALIQQIALDGLRSLSEADLMGLVDYLLTTPQLRTGLRGNVRFLGSVAAQYHRKRMLTPRQRQGVLNILEKAYPHNLAVELRRFA